MEKTATEVKIPVPWGYIAGKWWGPADKVPILCIHGWQDNAGTFDPLMELMPSDIAFLCIDLPGHGLSSHIPQGMAYHLWWDGITYIRRIVKHYGWSSVSLMGHSLGGGMSLLYAASYPSEMQLLICLDVIAPIFENRPEQIVNGIPEIIDSFLNFDEIKNTKDPIDKYDEMIEATVSGHKNTLTRKSCEILMKRGMYCYDNDTYRFSRDNRVKVGWLGPLTVDIVVEFAKRITCRYMNIKAMPGRPYDNWPMYNYLLGIIEDGSKDYKFYKVTGSHHLHLNEPEKIAPLITDFLK